MRFKKSTFWVQKVHIFGIPYFPNIDPGYGPGVWEGLGGGQGESFVTNERSMSS